MESIIRSLHLPSPVLRTLEVSQASETQADFTTERARVRPLAHREQRQVDAGVPIFAVGQIATPYSKFHAGPAANLHILERDTAIKQTIGTPRR